MVVVVTRPTFLPARRITCAMGVSFVPSGRTFTAPLNTREPLPHALLAADESVTRESSELVSNNPVTASGSCSRRNQIVPLPRTICEKGSAIDGTPILIPSETIKITFFGARGTRGRGCADASRNNSPLLTSAAAPACNSSLRERSESVMCFLPLFPAYLSDCPFALIIPSEDVKVM